MSIYATHWVLKFPRFGDAYTGCEWVEVLGQAVPGHIGSPTPGCGYESGDPFADFLPPAIALQESGAESPLRALVVVTQGTEKIGQRYISPLLVLSGAEYAALPFRTLHDLICTALRGGRPRVVAEVVGLSGQVRLILEDGSHRERPN